MRIDHGRIQTSMAKQLLYPANVIAAFDQRCREAMSECMRRDTLREIRVWHELCLKGLDTFEHNERRAMRSHLLSCGYDAAAWEGDK